MKDINISSYCVNPFEFNFGSTDHRYKLVNDLNFTYDHYKLNDGAATVGGGRIGNLLYFSVSFCSPKDNFSRKHGRQNIYENIIYDDCSHRRAIIDISEVVGDPPALVLMFALYEYINRGRNVPQWARDPVISFRNKQRNG